MHFINRDILPHLIAHLNEREITLILGPRQVGKTTLMVKMSQELKTRSVPVLFLNLDIESDWQHMQSQERLLMRIRASFGKEPGVVFIDEIQRKEDAGRFIKGIYDQNLPYKFVISGSGSLELKEKVVESLAGRKRIFDVNPLSFLEFAQYKTSYKYEDRIKEWLRLEEERAILLLEEYLSYGGYPEVLKKDTHDQKVLVLGEIYRSYLDRDVSGIINVDKPREYNLLFQYLAGVVGYPLNYTSIGKHVGLSPHTVKLYLWYMEKTYMIRLVRPFYRNPRKELIKAPTPYFVDLGIRNYQLQNWTTAKHTFNEFGFQNFIGNELFVYHWTYPINYWRTKDQSEVDFISGSFYDHVPIEVKYTHTAKMDIPRSLKNFIRRYNPKKAFIIATTQEMELEYSNTTIYVRPFWDIDKIHEDDANERMDIQG